MSEEKNNCDECIYLDVNRTCNLTASTQRGSDDPLNTKCMGFKSIWTHHSTSKGWVMDKEKS